MKFATLSAATALIGLCSASSLTAVQEYEEDMNSINSVIDTMNIFKKTEKNSEQEHILRKLFLSPITKNMNSGLTMKHTDSVKKGYASFILNYMNTKGLQKYMKDLVTKDSKNFHSVEKTLEVLAGVSNAIFPKNVVESSGFVPVMELSNIYCGLINEIAKIEDRECEAVVSAVIQMINKLIEVSKVFANTKTPEEEKAAYPIIISEMPKVVSLIKEADEKAQAFFNNIEDATFEDNKELLLNAINLKSFVKSLGKTFETVVPLVTSKRTEEEEYTQELQESIEKYTQALQETIKTIIFFAVRKNNLGSFIGELEQNIGRMNEGMLGSLYNGFAKIFSSVQKVDDKLFFNEEESYVDVIGENINKIVNAEVPKARVALKADEVPSPSVVPTPVVISTPKAASGVPTPVKVLTPKAASDVSNPKIGEVKLIENPSIADEEKKTEVVIVDENKPIDEKKSIDEKKADEKPSSNFTLRNIIIVSVIAFALGIAGLLYFRSAYKMTEIDN